MLHVLTRNVYHTCNKFVQMKNYVVCIQIYMLFHFRKEEGRREGKDQFLHMTVQVIYCCQFCVHNKKVTATRNLLFI
jgi:hypothetical protein